ncbi:alpha-ketoglutarate-dependent dioxygenase AlkB [Nakamurella sp.]|uniref:alpha-ketoglutarate-dependent dioxygenase AlkB n=1 Tax=Nakamurella sp. TaxID=1869182 RepID=UPI003B3AC2FE
MSVLHQPSMFDTPADGDGPAAPALGSLEDMTRTELSAGAWVDHRPGWLAGSEPVLDALLRDVPWRAEERQMYDRQVAVPRLLCWYSGAPGEPEPFPHPVLAAARAALNRHYRPAPADRFVTAGLCLYRDGADSVAWHGDRIGRGATHDTMVAILSVGSGRTLALRPHGGGAGPRFHLGHGDLVVMGGSCQRTWEHAVPKTARPVGPRVSIQFRPVGVA